MRKIFVAAFAIAALCSATPLLAQDSAKSAAKSDKKASAEKKASDKAEVGAVYEMTVTGMT